MPGPADFATMVPGFDFLQNLLKNSGAALPNMGQWIAPTLNPEELEKRIGELRTVQFWLEQNAKLLGATIQALEVQRMTLSTLKTMNLPLDELRKSMELRPPDTPSVETPEPHAATPAAAAPGAVDPMQWWGALTQQFTELAAGALKDSGADVAKTLAATVVKQSFDAAKTLQQAVAVPGPAAAKAAKVAKTSKASGAARAPRKRSGA